VCSTEKVKSGGWYDALPESLLCISHTLQTKSATSFAQPS
jgi:hypothetical protein